MAQKPNPNGSRPTVTAGVRFQPDVFSDLEIYAEKYFSTDRTKAINHILRDFFRKQKKARPQMADNNRYKVLTAFSYDYE